MDDKELNEYADSGLLPMKISETGSSDEPLDEAIICTSISGGAQFVNGMPKNLTLERVTSDGRKFWAHYEIRRSRSPAEVVTERERAPIKLS